MAPMRRALDARKKTARARRLFADAAWPLGRENFVILVEPAVDGDEMSFRVRLPPVPDGLPEILGDCIHNLRSALDHLAWQLSMPKDGVLADPEARLVQFPICDDTASFRRFCNQKLPRLTADAVALLEAVQPYQADFEPLRVLRELDNIDKHRTLLLVGAIGTTGFEHSLHRHGIALPYSRDWIIDGAEFMRLNKRHMPRTFSTTGSTEIIVPGELAVYFREPSAEGYLAKPVICGLIDVVDGRILPHIEQALIGSDS